MRCDTRKKFNPHDMKIIHEELKILKRKSTSNLYNKK